MIQIEKHFMAPVSSLVDRRVVDNSELFIEPFFDQFQTISRSITFKDGTTKEYSFPTFYADVTTSTALFTVDYKESVKLIPPGLKLKRVLPNRAILAITSYHYGRVRGMAPYNEVAIALIIEGAVKTPHAYVLSMPVTSYENYERGHQFWALPKEVMPIVLHEIGDDFVTTLPFMTLKVPTKGKAKLKEQQITLHSVLQGQTIQATSTSQGIIVEAIKIQGLIGLKFGEHGGLVIGHGETADLLRKLKVANIPFKTSFAREVTSAFGLPFCSSTSV